MIITSSLRKEKYLLQVEKFTGIITKIIKELLERLLFC